ncbi:MAG: serine hydrolase [Cyclobacteriaceae bacterium]|nr:serine hydrolase [Cyclobacteriaceae bacterium]
MRIFLTAIALVLLTGQLANAQYKSANRKLDAMIREGMAEWKIPGMGVVVVKDGRTVFSSVYGIRDIDTQVPVESQTLFAMASTTKAMIALCVGMLVDEGKLQWTDRVRQHLPEFRLADAYLTDEARVQDLLTHNLGIPGADLLWIIDSLSTAETLRRFEQVNKTYPVRGGFEYNNIMYAIAGEVITRVSGMHWTRFLQERLLNPLGMYRTIPQAARVPAEGNYVTPHFDDLEEGLETGPLNFSDQIGAAGMVWSCIDDMAVYLAFLLNGGAVGGQPLLAPATFAYLFQPRALIPEARFYPTATLTQPHWRSYGLGWFQQDYKGARVDFHTGSLGGLVSIAGLLRDEGLAVYVFANLDHAELRHAIMWQVFDLYALGEDRNWHRDVFDLYSGIRAQSVAALIQMENERVPGTRPGQPLQAYAGTYAHPVYGQIAVGVQDDSLTLAANGFRTFTAGHWHYDTFRTVRNADWRTRTLVQFVPNAKGQPEKLIMFEQEFVRVAPR